MTFKALISLIFLPSLYPKGINKAQIKPCQILIFHLNLMFQRLCSSTFVLIYKNVTFAWKCSHLAIKEEIKTSPTL